jgi:hypothetical protein
MLQIAIKSSPQHCTVLDRSRPNALTDTMSDYLEIADMLFVNPKHPIEKKRLMDDA